MKIQLCVLLVFVAFSTANNIGKKDGRLPKGPGFTRVFSQWDGAGHFYDFTDYVPDLRTYNFDNSIRSACLSGLWFYYEQTQYNERAGLVYWMHGIEFCADFPNQYSDKTSSLRFAGSPFSLNGDSWTVYEGELFTGSEFWGDSDVSTVGVLNDRGSSVVLTGNSAWTFYSGTSYSGRSVCVYPNTDHDIGPNGDRIDFGIYPSMRDLGFSDNSISSVAKGCWSRNVAKPVVLEAITRSANGAMGVLRP